MRMPYYMYIKIANALNRQKKAINGCSILFLGVAYKPNLNDTRESPALEIMDITAHKSGIVSYHDPYVPHCVTKQGRAFASVILAKEILQNADCVVLTTNHKDFDIEFIKENEELIVDLRNMVKEEKGIYKL